MPATRTHGGQSTNVTPSQSGPSIPVLGKSCSGIAVAECRIGHRKYFQQRALHGSVELPAGVPTAWVLDHIHHSIDLRHQRVRGQNYFRWNYADLLAGR